MGQFENKDQAFDYSAGIAHSLNTGTDSSQAITMHTRAGQITSSTTNLAADTVETITMTNNQVKATDIILASVSGGGNAAGALSVCPLAAAGSVTFKVRNNTPGTAATAAYVISFIVVKKVV